MDMPNHLPGNPYAERLANGVDLAVAEATTIMALAWEQRQRNILAYRTAKGRGINLDCLQHLGGDDE